MVKIRFKILIIIPSLSLYGGAEKVAASLSFPLSEKYDIYFLTFYKFKDCQQIKGKEICLNQRINWQRVLLPIKIYKNVKIISPDLIISFLDYINIIVFLLKYITKMKIPLICSIRNNPNKNHKGNFKLKFSFRVIYNSNSINTLIVNSELIKKILTNSYRIKENKIIKIFNPIDFYQLQIKKEEEIIDIKSILNDNSIIKFINIGRLVEQKGHRYLIDAFNQVKRAVNNTKLIIIGHGPLKQNLEIQIKKLGLTEDILLLGFRKNPIKYLGKCDIFVLSSIFEGQPNVLLEALSCGIPIISTNCDSGPREILNDGKYGILTKIGDSKDLAENMVKLIKNKDLYYKFKNISRDRAELYDISNVSKKWMTLINSILQDQNKNKI